MRASRVVFPACGLVLLGCVGRGGDGGAPSQDAGTSSDAQADGAPADGGGNGDGGDDDGGDDDGGDDGGGDDGASGTDAASTDAPIDKAAACAATGGIVADGECCQASTDFPANCLTGACSCWPGDGNPVKMCLCPKGTCWTGDACEAPPPKPKGCDHDAGLCNDCKTHEEFCNCFVPQHLYPEKHAFCVSFDGGA